MNVAELLEADGRRVVAILPGRFHPFHRGHASMYQALVGRFGRDNVWVATSNKVELPKSPFTFSEKLQMMQLAGIPADRVVETKNPYQVLELTSNFDPNSTVLIFAVSEKDMAEDPRFSFKPKKDGSPGYLQPLPSDISQSKTMGEQGYVIALPTKEFTVLGKPMKSATEVRADYAQADDETRKKIIKDLFGGYNNEVKQIMDNKLTGQTEDINEAHGNSKIYDKCWDGYKKVPGKKRGEKGSCVKESIAWKTELAEAAKSLSNEAAPAALRAVGGVATAALTGVGGALIGQMFAPFLGATAGGIAGAIGGYKAGAGATDALWDKVADLFGSKENAEQAAMVHAQAAAAGEKSFEFGGKKYPVTLKPQDAQKLNLEGVAEGSLNEIDASRAEAQAAYMQGQCMILAVAINQLNPTRYPIGYIWEYNMSAGAPDMQLDDDEWEELSPEEQEEISKDISRHSVVHAYVRDQETDEYIDARGRHKTLPNLWGSLGQTRFNEFPGTARELIDITVHGDWDEVGDQVSFKRGQPAFDSLAGTAGVKRAQDYAVKYLEVEASKNKAPGTDVAEGDKKLDEITGWAQSVFQKKTVPQPKRPTAGELLKKSGDKRSELQRKKDAGKKNWFAEEELEEGWKEKLAGVALSLGVAAGGAQADVLPAAVKVIRSADSISRISKDSIKGDIEQEIKNQMRQDASSKNLRWLGRKDQEDPYPKHLNFSTPKKGASRLGNQPPKVSEGVGRIVKGVNTTADVGPDEIVKQAKKFGNKVDRDGRPPEIKANGVVKAFNLGLLESLHQLDKDDPMLKSQVHVPGVGVYSIESLHKNLSAKFADLAERMQNMSPDQAKQAHWLLKNSALSVMLDALAQAYEDLEAKRRRGGKSSRGITK